MSRGLLLGRRKGIAGESILPILRGSPNAKSPLTRLDVEPKAVTLEKIEWLLAMLADRRRAAVSMAPELIVGESWGEQLRTNR